MATDKTKKRSILMRALIPAMVSRSLPAGSAIAFAAISANQEVRRAEVAEQQVASDVVSVIAAADVKLAGSNKQLTDAEIAAFPALSVVLRNRPELRNRIDDIVLKSDQQAATVTQQAATQVITAIRQATADPNNKLTNTELDKLPELKAVIDSDPKSTLRADIDVLALAADARNLTSDVISGITVAAQDPNNTLSAAELANRPRLAVVVQAVPALKQQIDTVARSADANRLASEVMSAITTAAANVAPNADTLTDAQLAALPRLAALVQAVPAIRQQIDQIAAQLP